MLFIVYGATLEWGWKSRQFFHRNGFQIIKKYNYVDENSPVDSANYKKPENDFERWYDDKIYVEKEEYEHCDFRYELNGVHIGFNQEQIMDAVRGVRDGIVTLAAASLDFIKRIKLAYGDYVTVIYLCMDRESKKHEYESASFTESEREARLLGDNVIRQVFLDNYESFDLVIPYTGNGTVFDENAVYRMYTSTIERRRTLERRINNKNYIDLPYQGKEPFIFISYARADKEMVYPVLSFLQASGYRVWYDDGIPGGANWRKIIALKISECTDFILFSSKNARQSENIAAELNGADLCNETRNPDDRIKVITVRLDDTRMGLETEMYLSRKNMLSVNDKAFRRKLMEALDNRTRQK